MIRDSELSQFSLISCKKSTSFPLRRNRAEFENDYRQEITQKSKILNPDSKVLQPKTLNLEQISLETKQKLMDSNISHSSYNDVYINELKQHLILKSNQIQKYRRISEKIDTFLEQDEKYADCKTLKDVRKSLNDGNNHKKYLLYP